MRKSLLNKMILYSLAVFLGAILSAVVICTVGNVRRTLKLTNNITRSATRVVSQIAGQYDMNELAQAPGSEEYLEFEAALQSICNNDGVEYVYVYIPDMDNGKLKYVIGVASDERKSTGTLEKTQAGEVIEHDFSDGEKNAWNGKTKGIRSVRDNARYGRQMCTYALIKNQNNKRIALAGADYSIDKIYREIISDTALKMLKVMVVLAGIFAAAAFFVKKKIYDPITFLFQNMKNYVSAKAEDHRTFEPVELHTNDEIQHLADYFNEMAADMDNYADEVKILAGKQAKAETELEVARRIQYGIVGARKDLCLADKFMISARMKSARQVGGDFYDSFRMENGKICAFIGDVSGKGIAAALFMVFVRTLMREKLMDIPDLANAMNEVNREICNANPEGMFVTAFAVVFESDSGKFRYVNAGHNKPVVIHDGKAEILDCSACMALGVFDDSEYEQYEREFCSGDILYLYTDGVTEAVNPDRKFFGEENLRNACSSSDHTARGVCMNVSESLKRFTGDNTEQFDDVTMLAVQKCRGYMELSCKLTELEKIKESIFRLPADEVKKKKIYLACEEIFSNIVNYSGADSVQFYCRQETDRFCIIFIDDGKAFNPLESSTDKDFEEFDEGGMGIMLVKELCQDISYSCTDGNNILRMGFADGEVADNESNEIIQNKY